MAASFAIIPYFLSCTKMSKVQPAAISISAAEQETGLSKDVLRAWERRYGFPAPYRDAHGDRRYPAEQIRRLQLLRALIEMGDRPGKLMALTEAQLAGRLGARRRSAKLDVRPNAAVRIAVAECMDLLAVASSAQLEARLDAEMTRLGLERFAIEVAAPLCVETGLAWQRGDIGVHQEHLFSQLLARCLRQSIERVGHHRADRWTTKVVPKVLLTTVPGEIHELGLLMVEGVLCAHGVASLNLGPQMPLDDVVASAKAHGCRVVALSFSSWFDARRAHRQVLELRRMLPMEVELWLGGSNAALRRELPDGTRVFTDLDQIAPALASLSAPVPATQNQSG